jgi:hypothetical protein
MDSLPYSVVNHPLQTALATVGTARKTETESAPDAMLTISNVAEQRLPPVSAALAPSIGRGILLVL